MTSISYNGLSQVSLLLIQPGCMGEHSQCIVKVLCLYADEYDFSLTSISHALPSHIDQHNLSKYPIMNYWIEITKTAHQHGGSGWEFGTCLWSPSKNAAGHDLYAIMRTPKEGDTVIHFLEDSWDEGTSFRIVGRSTVAASYSELSTPPPTPGAWEGRDSYYKIPLTNYDTFSKTISVKDFIETFYDEILSELDERPRHYPFISYRNASEIRLGQGVYLAFCTEHLRRLITIVLEPMRMKDRGQESLSQESLGDYSEGKRKQREVAFFARNAALVAAAKQVRGTVCECCGFDFQRVYGSLGSNYIECHHLNPLSERPPQAWDESVRTTVDDVRMLCSNCHRMIHRRRPALTVEELRAMIEGSLQ